MKAYRRRSVGIRDCCAGVVLVALATWNPLSAAAGDRVALVIGNSSYASMPLKNPANDARAMTAVLQDTGFRVITVIDADLKAMQRSMLEFSELIDGDSTALVFYAGHGVQADGHNYLLPVDAEIESESELRFEGLDLGDILDELDRAGARVNIVILDACRNNPFERKLRGRGRGLAAVDAARGTLIAYATAPGSTAADGDGDNGLYTAALLKAIRRPNSKVEEVFKEVRIAVAEASNGAQIPWESSSLTGDFIFVNEAPRSEVEQPALPVGNTLVGHEEDAPDSSCDDLSGRWANSTVGPAACPPPVLTFTRTGKDIYDVEGVGCMVPLAGTARREGRSVVVNWQMLPCSGETRYAMDARCASGSGALRINPSLLCADTENTSSIQRTNR